MSALEREIVEKFHQLDASAKQRVLESLTSDLHAQFDYAGWHKQADALQARMRVRLGDDSTTGVLQLLVVLMQI